MNLRWPYEKVYEIAKTCKTRSEFKYKCKPAYEAAHRWHYFDRDDWDWFEDGQKLFAEKRRKWTRDAIMEEARKYESRKDFAEGAPGAYGAALKIEGLLDEMDWFVQFTLPRDYWNYEHCYEEAKKYKTRTEFLRGTPSAYNAALKGGWLDDYTWFESTHVKRGTWTYEKCYEHAKRFKYKKDFVEQDHKAYDAAFSKGWLPDYTWLIDQRLDVVKGKIDSVYVYEFPDNVAYVGRTLIKEQSNRHCAHQQTDVDSVCRYLKKTGLKIPDMKILESELTLSEGQERESYWVEWYKNNGWTMLNRAKTGSLGGLNNTKWTNQKLKDVATKYSTFYEFRTKESAAYAVAANRGIIDEFSWLVRDKKPNKYWTRERCYEEAKNYQSRIELYKGNAYVYRQAKVNGWLDDYTWFRPSRRSIKSHNDDFQQNPI